MGWSLQTIVEKEAIYIGGQFLFIVLEFFSDRIQCTHLDGKASTSVDVVSGALQGSVLWPLMFILYTSELFHIVENHIVGYTDDNTIYAVNSKPLSTLQVME